MSAWTGLKNNYQETELPHYAYNEKTPDDAFFTNPIIAKALLETFQKVCKKENIELSNKIFIEPSAGNGSFLNILPEKSRIGIDTNPGNKEIQEANFLKWSPPDNNSEYVFIGNPPFGHRGAIALAFIRRAFLFSNVVAFILPASFYSNGKGTNMKRVMYNADNHTKATLIHNESLDKDSFYYPDSKKKKEVNAVFQIWIKGESKNNVFIEYDVSEYAKIYSCCTNPKRFCGLGKNRVYDCFIASTFYGNTKIVDSFAKVQYGSGFGIQILKNKENIMEVLSKANWLKHSTVATNSCRHIRIHHIKELLGKAGFGKLKQKQTQLEL